MNQNLARHKSPTQRAPAQQPASKPAGYTPNPNDQSSTRLQRDSSTEQSSKQEQYSQEQVHHSKEVEDNLQSNINFFKNKKQEAYTARPEGTVQYLKNNSEKVLGYKVEARNQHKTKNSPEKYADYYGFKVNSKNTNIKEKLKMQAKLSESGDSEISHNSTHSNNLENSSKNFKFFNKKLDKKYSQQHLLKLGSKQFYQQSRQQLQKLQPFYLQQKKQLNKKCSMQNFGTRNDQPFIYNEYRQRKKSPSNVNACSPSKRQDINLVVGNDNGNGIYKRSSLTPQNKLQVAKPAYNYDQPKNSLTPRKSANIVQKQYTPPKVSPSGPPTPPCQQKITKLTTFYPSKSKKSPGNIDFSFSKQRCQKNPPESGTSYIPKKSINTSSYHNSPPLNPTLSPRTPFPFKTITIDPLFSANVMGSMGNNSVTFIILEKLAENRSSSIYKCLHPETCMVFCLKRCAVNCVNLEQLVVQHKISISFMHPNLVRGYASFYDKNYLYLLMQYMDGKSLLNRNQNLPFIPKIDQYQLSASKNPTSLHSIEQKSNRLSFKQRPKIRQTMYSHQYQNEKFEVQSQRSSNLHSLAYTTGIDRVAQKIEKLYFIKNVLEQILEGLQFLHQNNIIHRDLKPDNIFVSHICYKIGDFGSCTYTNSQQYIGTLDYAAPQIMLRQKYDKSIDLWSVGCIAYELDVGRPPFYHYDRNETIRRIVNVQYDEEHISDAGLREFIGKLLVKSGGLRMTAGEAFKAIRVLQFGQSTPTYYDNTAYNNPPHQTPPTRPPNPNPTPNPLEHSPPSSINSNLNFPSSMGSTLSSNHNTSSSPNLMMNLPAGGLGQGGTYGHGLVTGRQRISKR